MPRPNAARALVRRPEEHPPEERLLVETACRPTPAGYWRRLGEDYLFRRRLKTVLTGQVGC